MANDSAAPLASALAQRIDLQETLRDSLSDMRHKSAGELAAGPLRGTLSRLDMQPGETDLFALQADSLAPGQAADPELDAELRQLMLHDLRSLLQSVFATIEPILEPDAAAQGPDPEALRDDIRDRVAQTQRQISRLLSIVNGETRNWLEPVGTDLSDILSEIVTQIAPLAKQRGKSLVFHASSVTNLVLGPAVLLRELAQNTIDNALKYGSGTVDVRLDQRLVSPGEWAITLDVWQDGPGVTQEFFERLCGGAKPASGTRNSHGLRIMQRAMTWLGGDWERLQTPHQSGLRARFILPEAPDSDTLAQDDPDPEIVAGDLSGRVILVVEDNPINREWAGRALRKAGAQVISAPDGESALSLSHGVKEAIDIALLDLSLPGMDGFALAQRFSVTRPDMLLFGLSGQADQAARDAGHAAGIATILEKPILARDLVRFLDAAVTRKEGSLTRKSHSEPARSQGDTVFDAAIAAELREDLGTQGARNFMLKALQEAQDTLIALREQGYCLQTRPLLHSAVGSSGITGLKGVEIALRAVQNAGDDANKHGDALNSLAEAIAKAEGALNATPSG